jgi:hypothetical protein
LKEPVLLKLDCEGSEFSIIKKTSPEILKKFSTMIIEYHSEAGDKDEIIKKLKNLGFKTKVQDSGRNIGLITAKTS